MAKKHPPSRWHSRRGAQVYMEIVSLESSLAGLLSSGRNQNGWDYIYERNDGWFKGLNSPLIVKFAIDNLLSKFEEILSQFIPRTPSQKDDFELLFTDFQEFVKLSNDSYLIQKSCFEKKIWISKSHSDKLNLEFPKALCLQDNCAYADNDSLPFSGFHFCRGSKLLKGASFFRGVLHGEIVEIGDQNNIVTRREFHYGYESFEKGFPEYYPKILTPSEAILRYYSEGVFPAKPLE